ncbi:MAG: hypothetical protein ACE5HI_12355 [bacterium]
METVKISSEYYCGVDLHARTIYICVMNRDGKILLNRNITNNFKIFKGFMESFLPDLVVGCESTLRLRSGQALQLLLAARWLYRSRNSFLSRTRPLHESPESIRDNKKKACPEPDEGTTRSTPKPSPT